LALNKIENLAKVSLNGPITTYKVYPKSFHTAFFTNDFAKNLYMV